MANDAVSPRSDSSVTRKAETVCRHAQENYEKDLKAVQELEGHLEITHCWVPEDEEWQAAARLMNQSGTGYKLRKHIGKALQTRSAALSQYNAAAKVLGRQTLEFEEVVEYAFLADFDLLRDTWKDILTCPWASPTAHLAINMYFKLCWAEEEVVRLNVEIRHVVTYLIDKDRYLRACEALYQDTNPALAYQISRYHAIRSRFTPLHLHTLKKISHLPRFRGTLTPGISVSRGPGDSAHVLQRVPIRSVLSSPPICTDDGEEEADEDLDDDHGDDLEEQCEALQHILSVTTDT
ncbi:hypothetical protein M404DRAFT_33147 [Pisolithus tinctorius Marx 270]|uniref:Uncharacterized protein n=1 Tax=Pisolithus tinctorius Marx 270 TaxID=870435 RepID=A0A0C3N643_PISTI|nr:hypothetical protein M404DRAFT_33147 [Pisolithus tinctorius Marx 270]